MKMDDFDFDTDLFEASPVLWDKTGDICKDRNETKKAWGELCIRLQEDFEDLGDFQKTAFVE